MAATFDEVKALKPLLLGTLDRLGIEASVGVHLGTGEAGEFSLSVHLQSPAPAGIDLPGKIEGVDVHYRVVGPISLS
jgi:hypothetical protein